MNRPTAILALTVFLCACQGPAETEPQPTGRILGRPLLVVDYSVPLAGRGFACDSVNRWALFDDGHILFCDTLLTHRDSGSYRVAQLTRPALRELMQRLPVEPFRSEKSMQVVDATDLPDTSIWLRDGATWRFVDVGGIDLDWPGSWEKRAKRWGYWALDIGSPPPPAFAAILAQARSVPLNQSVPLEGCVPSAGEPSGVDRPSFAPINCAAAEAPRTRAGP